MFCDELLAGYDKGRERPHADETSRMSPYLRWGEISPYRLWHMATAYANRRKTIPADAIRTFRQELYWRDFNAHLLFHFGDLANDNFNDRFDTFPWRSSKADLEAWQRGLTGYPIVDAGMRQLWQTGWMHNRVRMIVGSFLTKDLLIDWREGERWFWDTLVDGRHRVEHRAMAMDRRHRRRRPSPISASSTRSPRPSASTRKAPISGSSFPS